MQPVEYPEDNPVLRVYKYNTLFEGTYVPKSIELLAGNLIAI